MSESSTLYANPSQTRFYFIPDDAEVASGGLVLRSLTGQRKDVSLEAVEAYEIPEDRAKEITRLEIGRYTRQASGFLAGVGAFMQGVADKAEERKGRKPGPGPREANVADALGITPDQLRNDPDAVIEGLKGMWSGLQVVLKDALATGKEADETTRERIRFVAELAGADIDAAETTVDELRTKVHDLLMSQELEERVRNATARLNEISAELHTSADSLAEEPSDDN
ncbi:MAG: hypothetical protein JRI25_13595 [Deltaproteobacteria bacterium]|nr:hypothetical protein [Deltaproteobacteria bacterium]